MSRSNMRNSKKIHHHNEATTVAEVMVIAIAINMAWAIPLEAVIMAAEDITIIPPLKHHRG